MVGIKRVEITAKIVIEVWDDDFDPDDLVGEYKEALDGEIQSKILPTEGVEGIFEAEVTVKEVKE